MTNTNAVEAVNRRHIETLEWLASQYLPGGPRDVKGTIRAAIAALAAMSAASGQEPVAWLYTKKSDFSDLVKRRAADNRLPDLATVGWTETPLYAHPASSDQEKLNTEVSQEEALKFLGSACRNWEHIAPLSKDDVQDVADALKCFLITRARQTGGSHD
jgi:hypothetical protein